MDSGFDDEEQFTRGEQSRRRTRMPTQDISERDLVLPPNEQALLLEVSTGIIRVYVGPIKKTLEETDIPVFFNDDSGRFERCNLANAISAWPVAKENQYIVLENPAEDAKLEHPAPRNAGEAIQLDQGRTLNIHGPITFPVWPAQSAKVVDGHTLRSNQYLIVQVYNEKEATKNWPAMVLKPQTDAEVKEEITTPVEEAEGVIPEKTPKNLTTGQRFIVPGTLASFFMPPTGISVVQDSSGDYVRKANTLELLEYCILLSERGDTRYVKGPDVVFPRPDETFVERDGNNKFRAIELNSNMGLYIKVVADYDEHKAGDELFITGSEQAIYWPRREHALIRYGEREIHYAVAIPKGEARYVLNRDTGDVDLVEGPKMFLPDPSTQVVVRRILSEKEVHLWFPGNIEALAYNRSLARISEGGSSRGYVEDTEARQAFSDSDEVDDFLGIRDEKRLLAEQEFERQTQYTPPRTIVLDTKYDGAVTVIVWPQYAIMVVDKTGNRRVVVGPEVVLLTYDEALTALAFSTGFPKNTDHLTRTVYLLTMNNRVKDQVTAETKDLVEVNLKLAYRVNFEGEDSEREKWFDVENYVQLLTERMRSLLRSVISQIGIEEFYSGHITIVRDSILGEANEEGRGREGYFFDENSMRVMDVEVLRINITGTNISERLRDAQHDAVAQTLRLQNAERELEATKRLEVVEQESLRLKDTTDKLRHDLNLQTEERRGSELLGKETTGAKIMKAGDQAKLARQEDLDKIAAAGRARDKALEDQRIEVLTAELHAEVVAFKAQSEAITPQLISAMQSLGDKKLIEALSASVGPWALFKGTGIPELASKLVGKNRLSELLSSGFMDGDDERERTR